MTKAGSETTSSAPKPMIVRCMCSPSKLQRMEGLLITDLVCGKYACKRASSGLCTRAAVTSNYRLRNTPHNRWVETSPCDHAALYHEG
eukprot:3023643-Amphidinium_carterae.1